MKHYVSLAMMASFLTAVPSYIACAYTISKSQILHVGNGAEPRDMDPSLATGQPEGNVINNLFEGLTNADPFTLAPTPGVAESWSVSADGKLYTFKIRKNAKWSDGTPLTARDFEFSWERTLNPKTASQYAYQLYYIKNGEAYNQGKIKDPKQLGVKATDDYTLVVTLTNPTPFFLQLTSYYTLFPTPKHVLAKFPNGQEWTKPEHIVSNGAFKLKSWVLNQSIVLTPNDKYWGKDKIKLKEVIMYAIENADTEEKTFVSGGLHMTSTLPSAKIPAYRSQQSTAPKDQQAYQSYPILANYFYRFNTTKAPTNNVKVRQALAMTIDRKLIVDKVTKGGQLPATSFTPPGVAGYTYSDKDGLLTTSVTPQVIAKAKQLLAEAGYPEGKGMPKIEILYNTLEDHKKIALAIQQMWKKTLGVEVELYNQEWKVYLDNQAKLNFTISRSGWIGDYADPNTFLDMFVTGRGQNLTGWSNKTYDQLIEKAGQTLDSAIRFKDFQEAERILLTEMPIAPVFISTRQHLVSPKVKQLEDPSGNIKDWTPNSRSLLDFRNYVLVD